MTPPFFAWPFLPSTTVQERSWKQEQWEGSIVLQSTRSRKESGQWRKLGPGSGEAG